MSNETNQALTIVERGRDFRVSNGEEYSAAGELVKAAKAMINAIKADYKPQKQAADAAKKTILDAEKAKLTPLEMMVAEIEGKMIGWKSEQRRIADAETNRLAAEARDTQEAAASAAAAGDFAVAESLSHEATQLETRVVASMETIPDVDGISDRMNWRAEVVDINLIPRKYLLVDMPALNAIARRMKGSMNIPGVRAVGVPSMAVKS